MPATRVRAWKRRLHRVPRARGRYRTAVAAVADTSRAAMSRTCTGADSCPAYCTGCSRASSDSGAAASSASAAVSEQRAGRCDQQCRYGDYCKKLGYPRHYDLLFVFSSASKAAQRNPPRPCSFVRSKLGHPRMFHAKKEGRNPANGVEQCSTHPSERKSRIGKVGERDPFKLELAALINVKVTVAA